MKEKIYLVVCETIDPETSDVLGWFDCCEFDDSGAAIRWAENHVLDYIADKSKQLTVLEVESEDRALNYEDAGVIWCSQ